MGLAYKADFMACRPWGNRGDRKNDGFLKSERRLFQVYAPNEMTEAKAIAKIQEDFEGAKAYWGKHFDKWVFAHNAVKAFRPMCRKCYWISRLRTLGLVSNHGGWRSSRSCFVG